MHKHSEFCSICNILKTADDDYDTNVHKKNKEFWKKLPSNKDHSLSKHPVFTLSGEELDRASFKHTKDLAKKYNLDADPSSLQQLFMKMVQIEHKHKKQLEELAISAVAKLMKVDKKELNAKLSNDVEINDTEPLTQDEIKKLPKKLLDEANKRITNNAFAQGASVHGYLTAHFVEQIEEQIKKIEPELMSIYSKVSVGSHLLYWMMDMAAMNLKSSAAGSVKPEQDEQGNFTIKAVSPVFIVLVQELIKGVLEIRYLKSLQSKSSDELSDDDIKKIFQYADKIEDEPRLIQIGPELWRRFLKVYNNSNIKKTKTPIEIYEGLMKLPPKDLHDFVEKVVNNTDQAHKLLDSLNDDSVQEIEQMLKDLENPDPKVSSTITAPAPVKTPTPTKTPSIETPGKSPRIIPLPKPKNKDMTTAPAPVKTPTPTKTPEKEIPEKSPRIIPLPKPKNVFSSYENVIIDSVLSNCFFRNAGVEPLTPDEKNKILQIEKDVNKQEKILSTYNKQLIELENEISSFLKNKLYDYDHNLDIKNSLIDPEKEEHVEFLTLKRKKLAKKIYHEVYEVSMEWREILSEILSKKGFKKQKNGDDFLYKGRIYKIFYNSSKATFTPTLLEQVENIIKLTTTREKTKTHFDYRNHKKYKELMSKFNLKDKTTDRVRKTGGFYLLDNDDKTTYNLSFSGNLRKQKIQDTQASLIMKIDHKEEDDWTEEDYTPFFDKLDDVITKKKAKESK